MFRLTNQLRKSAAITLFETGKTRERVQKLLNKANDTPHMMALRSMMLPVVFYNDVEGCGKGMFAQETIEPDTLVDFTKGNIVLCPDPDEKLNYLEVGIKVKDRAGRSRTVDAVYTMDDTYFINHACDSPNVIGPNLVAVPRTLECPNGSIEILEYYTKRRVYANEQLTLDYYTHLDQETKKEVLDDHPKPGFVKCRCSPMCYNYIRFTPPVRLNDAH